MTKATSEKDVKAEEKPAVINEVQENPPVVQEPDKIPLNNFCKNLSLTVKSVELIGGFEHSERAAGRAKDFEAAYMIRFQEFVNKPV